METRKAFSERISALRSEKGLTQGALAEALGISRQSVTQYENGIRVPDIEVFRKFTGYFGVTSDYLLGISDNRTPETAAIGKKLGLSDEVIERLSEAAELLNQPESQSLIQTIRERSANGTFSRGTAKQALNVINTICLDTKLLTAIHSYLDAHIPQMLDNVSYGYYSFIDWGEISPEEYEDAISVFQAVNLLRIQKELDRLYQEKQGKYLDEIPEHSQEETNAKENKRQE